MQIWTRWLVDWRCWWPALKEGPSAFTKTPMAAKVGPGCGAKSERRRPFLALLLTNTTAWFQMQRESPLTAFSLRRQFGRGNFPMVVCKQISWQFRTIHIVAQSQLCLISDDLRNSLKNKCTLAYFPQLYPRQCRFENQEEGVWRCDGNKETWGGEEDCHCRDGKALEVSLHSCRHAQGDVMPAFQWAIAKYVFK